MHTERGENMAGKIIPRWEWRTFGEKFGEGEDRIRAYELGNFKKSSEKYILSRNSNENCKIRDDLMDIKSLQQINDDKLEQWYPTLKEGFPLKAASIQRLFADFFKIEVPALADSYTYEAFVALCKQQKDLCVVDVYKERAIYTINEAIVEIAETKFNGVPMRTVCVEHTDPANVIGVVRKLGLEGFENINYIQAMKTAVGML